jgi:tetratricopeptide (TPR) repeat protein
MFGGAVEKKDLAPWLSELARSDDDQEILMTELRVASRFVSAGVTRRVGGDPAVLIDLVVGNLAVQEAAFARQAKRVQVSLGGNKAGAFYLVAEDSAWKLLAMSAYAPPVTREAHRLLEAGDATNARTWLAAVKSEIEAVPNAEYGPYRHFLAALPTTDSLNDDVAMRLSALALLVVSSAGVADAEDLQRAGEGLATPAQEEILEAARFAIAREHSDGALALQAADNLERLKPGSPDSLQMRAFSYEVAQRWEDAERASRAWVAQRPGDGTAKRALVRALNGQKRYADALAVLAPEVQEGKADASHLNLYAWQALRADTVDSTSVKAAEDAFREYQWRDFSSGHTLACLYANQGRVVDARRVLLQLLEDHPAVDPLSGNIWLIRGLLAESLGETSAAVRAYRQIDRQDHDRSDSAHAIAATRLARLQ